MSPSSSGTGNTARVGVLGASGYTGGELLRLLAHHDGFSVGLLTAERRAGQSLGAVFPHLDGAGFPDLVKIEDAAWDRLDAVFCCLPHGTTQEVVAALPEHLKVVDLSADFRLADPGVYAEWYGRAHGAVALQVAWIDTQGAHLDIVGIRHGAAREVLGRSRKVRERGGQQPAGAALDGGDPQAAGDGRGRQPLRQFMGALPRPVPVRRHAWFLTRAR